MNANRILVDGYVKKLLRVIGVLLEEFAEKLSPVKLILSCLEMCDFFLPQFLSA